ncbi:hypothetical protein OBV_27830 [Oscillibacter valericigenes Sjm18-20]|nr:hypothetical protein OBV_27830 [Oscillibacter valericigenes Sjm18-20]
MILTPADTSLASDDKTMRLSEMLQLFKKTAKILSGILYGKNIIAWFLESRQTRRLTAERGTDKLIKKRTAARKEGWSHYA